MTFSNTIVHWVGFPAENGGGGGSHYPSSARNSRPWRCVTLPVIDRQLWAVFSGIHYFRHLLEVRQFHVLTDHKTLTAAPHSVSEPWSAKQQQQLADIAEYMADIKHIPGKDNVADVFPRPRVVTAAVTAFRLGVPEVGSSSPPSKPSSDLLRVGTHA